MSKERGQQAGAAVSETRDLCDALIYLVAVALFTSHRRAKNRYHSLRTGGHLHPFPSAVGKVPGDAEYATLYVYAMESICP